MNIPCRPDGGSGLSVLTLGLRRSLLSTVFGQGAVCGRSDGRVVYSIARGPF